MQTAETLKMSMLGMFPFKSSIIGNGVGLAMNTSYISTSYISYSVKVNHVKLGMKLNRGPWHVKLGSLARHWRWKKANKGKEKAGKKQKEKS